MRLTAGVRSVGVRSGYGRPGLARSWLAAGYRYGYGIYVILLLSYYVIGKDIKKPHLFSTITVQSEAVANIKP